MTAQVSPNPCLPQKNIYAFVYFDTRAHDAGISMLGVDTMPVMHKSFPAKLLDERLSSALDFVRDGAVVADIGTDHAYLPAALVLSGRISRAIAADLRPGPLAHAAATVAHFGLEDKITLRQTDGLSGLEREGITDIILFGMGGKLIARILGDAPFVRSPGIRLILQPMTHTADLRCWLTGQGFSIADERLSCTDGKIYQTICAEFCGAPSTLTQLEAELGPCNLTRQGSLLALLAVHKAEVLDKQIAGRSAAGLSVEAEAALRDAFYAAAAQAMQQAKEDVQT